VAAVAAAVVGQDLLDGDAVVGEPGLGSRQEPDRGLLGLIWVDFGIGEPRVVIDRGVDEAVAGQWLMMAAAPAAGAVGLAVTGPSGPAEEPVATWAAPGDRSALCEHR
jgi:hypothetical protein